jgi:hypothetical protein
MTKVVAPRGRRFTYFAIIGRDDVCVFDYCVAPPEDRGNDLKEFIVHGALDVVEEKMWDPSITPSGQLYLKVVDRHQDTDPALTVSAYILYGQLRLLLLQEEGAVSRTKDFFEAMHELCAKHLANPFTDSGVPFESEAFRTKAIAIFNEFLG